jgi:hypothetical protein
MFVSPQKRRAGWAAAFLLPVFLTACSPKNGANTGLSGTAWQFDHATGVIFVTPNPSASLQTITQYLENADQARFKTEKLRFFDNTRYGGIVPVALTGPVASTGTYTQQGNELRFTFTHRGYRDTPNDTQGLTPDTAGTFACLKIDRQTDDELVLLQDVPCLQEMEAVREKDPDKRAVYSRATATYYFRRVR